ncbi:hypothetical protein PLICRDRAFT_49966 [Plicaturopsis crispa FD-325 SS-3]|nr:hypothetical protein PLICRDRAFT_49966 [Plicaturopsis crispa FD-325 SS-3]
MPLHSPARELEVSPRRGLSEDTFRLLRGYCALVPPRHLTFPSKTPLRDINDFLVDDILCNTHLRAYPPSSLYEHTFWKWAIHNLEGALLKTDEDVEIDSRIYDHYVSLLPSLSAGGLPPPPCYATHFWKIRDTPDAHGAVNLSNWNTTTLLESRTTIENGTTGLRTWGAGLVLSHYIISHPEMIIDKNVLELGCGTGVLGIVCASIQHLYGTEGSGGSLCLTDNNEEVLGRCRANVGLPCNLSSRREVECSQLEWGDIPAALTHDADIILGADIVFDPELIAPLVETLHSLLNAPLPGDSARVAYVALTVRNAGTLDMFTNTAAESLHLKRVDAHFDSQMFGGLPEGGAAEDVRIFKICSKPDRALGVATANTSVSSQQNLIV